MIQVLVIVRNWHIIDDTDTGSWEWPKLEPMQIAFIMAKSVDQILI